MSWTHWSWFGRVRIMKRERSNKEEPTNKDGWKAEANKAGSQGEAGGSPSCRLGIGSAHRGRCEPTSCKKNQTKPSNRVVTLDDSSIKSEPTTEKHSAWGGQRSESKGRKRSARCCGNSHLWKEVCP